MRNNNARKKKVWRKKFKVIAAKDRELTVNNIPKTKPTFDKKSLIEVKFGEKDVHFMQKAKDWKNEKHPQPKRLQHSWKRWIVMYDEETHRFCKKYVRHRSDYIPYNKLKDESFYDSSGLARYPFSNKMPQHTYWERLIQHKLDKWKKKNPKPEEDLFEKAEDWEQKRFVAEQRFRDFVVSCYNKLPIMGNIVDRKNGKLKAIKIGEIKDIDGKGHNVNHPNLSPNDKLYKHAEAVAMNAMKMDKRILDVDLLNHKHDQKRPLNITRQSVKKAA